MAQDCQIAARRNSHSITDESFREFDFSKIDKVVSRATRISASSSTRRIFNCALFFVEFMVPARYFYDKCGGFVFFAANIDGALVRFDDVVANRKTQPSPFIFG